MRFAEGDASDPYDFSSETHGKFALVSASYPLAGWLLGAREIVEVLQQIKSTKYYKQRIRKRNKMLLLSHCKTCETHWDKQTLKNNLVLSYIQIKHHLKFT